MVTLSDTLTCLRKDVPVTVTVQQRTETVVAGTPINTNVKGTLYDPAQMLTICASMIHFLLTDAVFKGHELSLPEILGVLRPVTPGYNDNDRRRILRGYIRLRSEKTAAPAAPQLQLLSGAYALRVQAYIDEFLSFGHQEREAARSIFETMERQGAEALGHLMATNHHCFAAHQWVVRLRRESHEFIRDVILEILTLLNPDSPVLRHVA